MFAARVETTCCIAAGGPAGLMLGFLLARCGVPVLVLEKHADFLRDFRGDTIHPSTLEVMAELGLDDGVLALPHEKRGCKPSTDPESGRKLPKARNDAGSARVLTLVPGSAAA